MKEEQAAMPREVDKASAPLLPYTASEIGGFLLLVALYLVIDWMLVGSFYLATVHRGYPSLVHRYGGQIGGFIVGFLFAPFVLPLIVATMLQGSAWLRIPLGAILLILMAEWQTFWIVWEEGLDDGLEIWSVLFLVLLAPYFFAQVPFWALRWWFSWRIVGRLGESSTGLGARKLGLSQFFIWPVFIAVPLTVMRIGDHLVPYMAMIEQIITSIIVTLVAPIAGMLFLWIAFGRRPVVASLVLPLIALVIALVIERIDSVSGYGRDFYSFDSRLFYEVSLVTLCGSLGAMLAVVPARLFFRHMGWRLVIGRQKSQAAQA